MEEGKRIGRERGWERERERERGREEEREGGRERERERETETERDRELRIGGGEKWELGEREREIGWVCRSARRERMDGD